MAIHRDDPLCVAALAALQALRQCLQLAVVEHITNLYFHAEAVADARDQLHGQQRMPAQGKEVVATTDLFDTEQLAP